jgi:hypothetical protein
MATGLEAARARFDRAWNGCRCRGAASCMVCEGCMTDQIRAARNDALGAAARTACARCAGGAPAERTPAGHAHGGAPCPASAILDLIEAKGD